MKANIYFYNISLNSSHKEEFSDKSCTGNQNTHLTFSNFLFRNCLVYEIVWEKCGRDGQAIDSNVIRRMRFARWITKATNTHSEYVILNACPMQQWLHELASLLRYTYISSLVQTLITATICIRLPCC